ncbi:MAG: ABC transporter substrate-binding protein [Bacillota bacterium]
MKKTISVLFALCLLLLTACGGSEESSQSAETSEEKEPTSITVWVMGSDEYWRTYHDDLVERFHKDHPEIKVDLEYIPWDQGENQLITAATNGTLPDVSTIAGRWTAQMVEMGAVEPLDSYFPGDFATQFVDAAFDTTQYKGETWGLPVGFTTTGLFYRTDWLKEAGFAEPPKTWDEFLTVAEAMTAGDKQHGFGLVGHNSMETVLFWTPFLWSNGGELLNDDQTQAAFNSPKGIEALEFYVDLYKKGSPKGSTNYNRGDSMNLFLSDAVGMTTVGPWFPKMIKDQAPDMEYGIAPYPVKEKAVNMGTADHIIMSKASKNKEAAWTFMAYFTNQENDLIWAKHQGFIPYRKANLDDQEIRSNPAMAFFLDVAPDARTYPTLPQWPQIDQALADAIQLALMGEKTPEEALNDAADIVNEALK